MGGSVGGADHDPPLAGSQSLQKPGWVGKVFDRLEAEHQIRSGVVRFADVGKTEAGMRISLACMVDRLMAHVQSGRLSRKGSDIPGPVALTACRVHDVGFGVPRSEEEVALPVVHLRGTIARRRNHTLPSPGKHGNVGHGGFLGHWSYLANLSGDLRISEGLSAPISARLEKRLDI